MSQPITKFKRFKPFYSALVIFLTTALILPLLATAGKPPRSGKDQHEEARQKNALAPQPGFVPFSATESDEGSNDDQSHESTQIAHHTLENGMQVFFVPDHRTPAVVVQVWYQVGSADEPAGKTGISHLLEHMMFWNIEKKPKKRYKNRIEAMGGKYNAFTSRDFTAYYANVASVYLENVIQMEAQRMSELKFDSEQWEKERQVVLEERHLRLTNRPSSLLREQLLIAAFERSGLRNPIIGWNDDIESITEQDLYDWYQQWYQPDNAALVVVGDADFEQIVAMAEEHFGRIKNDRNKDIDPRIFQRLSEPEQTSRKRVELQADIQSASLMMFWKIPSMDRENFANDDISKSIALEMLASFLGDGENAWLYRKLVTETALATSISTVSDISLRTTGMLWIYANPRQGVDLETLERAIVAELDALAAKHIREVDLMRAQTELIVEATYLRDSPFYQAYVLGSLEFSGAGWQMLDQYQQMVGQTTVAQMMTGLSEFIRDKPYSIGYLRSKHTPARSNPDK